MAASHGRSSASNGSRISFLRVCRDDNFYEIPAQNLVAGDVVVLKPGEVFGDMVILAGSRVLVDESALTGEATPVQKEPIDPSMRKQVYVATKHTACSLHAGTRILEIGTSEKVLALVTGTGSYTHKGELLTNVLSYSRHQFKFDDEVKAVLLVLAVEAIVMIWLVFHLLQNEWAYAWFYGKHDVSVLVYSNRRALESPISQSTAHCPLSPRSLIRVGNGVPAPFTDRVCRFCVSVGQTTAGTTNQLSAPRSDSSCW
jgi:magnesium-transporting ATPase (P-type)